MHKSMAEKTKGRLRRKARVAKKIRGTTETPRLAVFRSARHIYAQLIDDSRGVTIATASSAEKDSAEKRGNRQGAEAVGKRLAERAKAASVSKVCFDRGGFRYHGRVKALAESARQAGLKF